MLPEISFWVFLVGSVVLVFLVAGLGSLVQEHWDDIISFFGNLLRGMVVILVAGLLAVLLFFIYRNLRL